MPSQADSATDRKRRYFIAAGTATYAHLDEKDQLPSVEADLARMEALFVGELKYERALPELGINPTTDNLRKIEDWLCDDERRSDDLVVFYYSGHGEVAHDRHYLCTRETNFDRLIRTAFPTGELALMLSNSPIQQVLILLDTCYAGRGSGDITSLLPRMTGAFRLDDESNAGIYVVAAAGPKEPAYPNLFSEAFVQAVTAPGASYSQSTVEYLALDAIVNNIKVNLGEQNKQRTELYCSRVQTISQFLPNPYFNPNAQSNEEELFSQLWLEDRLQEAIEVAGPRYTPPIHVELPIAQHFESLARTPAFFIRIKHILRDMKKAYKGVRLTNLGDAMKLLASTLNEKAHLFFTTILCLGESLVERLSWITVIEQADQVLRAAHNCLKHLDELKKQVKEENAQEPSNLFDASQYRGHRDITNDIDQFMGQVHQFRRFAQGVDAKLTNLPCLLLCGEAGQGKTHLFCDIARRRIADGLPTLLLMGQRFTQAEPWTQMIQQLGLPATKSRDDLLGALQASAQAKNVKTLILIDALNEGEGKKIWFNHLPAMLQTLSHYPWISIAVSVRSTYEHVVIPDELVNNKLIRVEHHGFADREYQATRTFFDYYGIAQPSIPLLVPEFQNPLFLKLLCKGLRENKQTKLPVGLHGITAVFKLFVNNVNKKIAGADFCDFNHKRPLVWQAIDALAEAMGTQQQDWLPIEVAERIINDLLPGRSYENSLYRHLISEGVLIENGHYLDQKEWLEVVQFAYERFSDHLIVKHLLDKHLDPESPTQIFLPKQPLAFLTEKEWRSRGLIEALCIQIPERVGKELPEIARMMANFSSVGQGFIQSIIWRDPCTITDTTRQYLNQYAEHWDDAYDQVYNVLLTVTTNPDHPFNADFLHERLMKDAMADRDANWSIFLYYQYGERDAVDRLVDWAWSPEDKSHIDDEAVRLCGVALTWFLTTPNRFLRDRATKALVNLFTHRIHTLIKVIEMFLAVDDPYISERLCAVAYACAMRSVDSVPIQALSQTIYNWIFRDGKPPVHILLRDYARNIIEYALYRGVELNIDVKKIQPPYGSDWLVNIPNPKAIEELGKRWEGMDDQERSRLAIYNSLREFGDFGRYVVERGVRNWTSLRLDEPLWRSDEEKLQDFVNSLSGIQKRQWELYQEVYQRQKEHWWTIQALLAKLTDEEAASILQSESTNDPQDIEVDNEVEAIKTEIAIAEQDFRKTLSDEKLATFDNQFLPFLRGETPNDPPPQFDLNIARNWIVQRVFEMGWTVKRFGWFDRHLDHNNFREAHKAERVGKKYQWIAYHEFLARLADNFQYRAPYSNHPQSSKYNGTWQLGVRNLDPSCLLKATRRGSSWRETALSWWFTTAYKDWHTVLDDVEWMQKSIDLPELPSLIEMTRPSDASQWLALDGFYHWEQPTPPEEEKYDLSRREVWFMLRGYLVHRQDCDELFAWAISQDFMGRWMPEGRDFYQIYLGEFYWSPAYAYDTDPFEGSFGWQESGRHNTIPRPILPLVDTYVQERNGFDCSINDGISIAVPTQLLVQRMGLEWRGVEGKYFDKSGQLIAFDPSVEEDGPKTLLIYKDAFLTFLKENGYCVIWTVLGEKQLIGENLNHDNWKGKLKISGAYRWINDQLEGKITPYFRSPTDRD